MSSEIVPALKFNEHPIHPNDEGNTLLQFRERGYAIVSGVFEPASVDAFVEQLRSTIRPGKEWWWPYEMPMDSPLAVWPARAPRLRQILRGAFGWSGLPSQPCLGHPAWLIKPHNPDARLVHDWHKDDDHRSLGTVGGAYQYPRWVHCAMYFADMTVEHGPTYVIPRSHRDGLLSPYSGAQEEPVLPHKADAVLWDQRLWHRASPRKVEGLRIMANFGFFGVPFGGTERIRLSPAQHAAYQAATDPSERILFGGPFEV